MNLRYKYLCMLISIFCFPNSNVFAQLPPSLDNGKGVFTFTNWKGPDIPVWYYYPETRNSNSNILIVMHGSLRNGESYRDQWVKAAKQTNSIIIVPEFSKKKFPKARDYNLGGVTNRFKRLRSKDKWTFSAIEPLFDEVLLRTQSPQKSYIIYGHARVKRAIAANSGWYTRPNNWDRYPFGIGRTNINKESIKSAFNHELVILLGEKDNNPFHKYLNRSVKAMRQGSHRLARGKYYYAYCEKKAKKLKTPFNWSIDIVEGVGHSNSKMIKGAIPYFQ